MYDFQGMNSRLQSFRQIEPSEGHQIRNLSWSPTADRFLCVTGSAQAKVAKNLTSFSVCFFHALVIFFQFVMVCRLPKFLSLHCRFMIVMASLWVSL
jgi:hypothetical protein